MMIFEKEAKTDFHWSNRRAAAVERRHKREQAKYPLFAQEIAQQQPSVAQEKARIERQFDHVTQHQRNFTAYQWRKARALYFRLPDSHRLAIATFWRRNRWIPKKAHYFGSLLHDWVEKGWRPNKLQVVKYGLENIPFDYCSITDGCIHADAVSSRRSIRSPQQRLF